MTKRAQKLIDSTNYSRATSPAICLLVDFACQNPGIDPRNYGGGTEGYRAYNSEKRDVSGDLRRFAEALQNVSGEGVTDAEVIAEAPHAFSGRLEWKEAPRNSLGVTTGLIEPHWDYCTGQYFPTEYRKAAATLLESALRRVRQSRPARKQMPRTIAELKALNEENGSCWFDRSSMRFFGTKIESGIIRSNRFVTSEQPPHGPRNFSVRTFDESGDVDTLGEFGGYSTRREALEAARTAPDITGD